MAEDYTGFILVLGLVIGYIAHWAYIKKQHSDKEAKKEFEDMLKSMEPKIQVKVLRYLRREQR